MIDIDFYIYSLGAPTAHGSAKVHQSSTSTKPSNINLNEKERRCRSACFMLVTMFYQKICQEHCHEDEQCISLAVWQEMQKILLRHLVTTYQILDTTILYRL